MGAGIVGSYVDTLNAATFAPLIFILFSMNFTAGDLCDKSVVDAFAGVYYRLVKIAVGACLQCYGVLRSDFLHGLDKANALGHRQIHQVQAAHIASAFPVHLNKAQYTYLGIARKALGEFGKCRDVEGGSKAIGEKDRVVTPKYPFAADPFGESLEGTDSLVDCRNIHLNTAVVGRESEEEVVAVTKIVNFGQFSKDRSRVLGPEYHALNILRHQRDLGNLTKVHGITHQDKAGLQSFYKPFGVKGGNVSSSTCT